MRGMTHRLLVLRQNVEGYLLRDCRFGGVEVAVHESHGGVRMVEGTTKAMWEAGRTSPG